MPSGGSLEDGTAPSGGMSQNGGAPGGGQFEGSLTLTGEEKTITVEDTTVITISDMGQSSDGTISDIAVGDILTVTMSGDTVASISVRHSGTGGNLPDAGASPSADTAG